MIYNGLDKSSFEVINGFDNFNNMKIFDSFIFQLATISALAYSMGNFLGFLNVDYILFGLWVSFNPTIGESIEESGKRLLGIMGGGFIGFVTMVALNQNTLSIAIGLALSVLLCFALGIPKSSGQAVVSFCMVAIGHYGQGLNQYYWERFTYNSIGIIVGTMASLLLPPPSLASQLKKEMGRILRQIGILYQILVNEYINPDFNTEKSIETLDKQIRQILTNNEKLLNFATVELSQGIGSQGEQQSLEDSHLLIKEILLMIKDLEQFFQKEQQNSIAQTLFPEISYLSQITYQSFQELADFYDVKSSSHLSNIYPNMNEALANLNNRIETLHHTQESKSYDLEQVIEISAFLDDLKSISHQLNLLAQMNL